MPRTGRVEDWRWGSSWRRTSGTKEQRELFDPSPEPFPHGYLRWINAEDKKDDLNEIRNAINRGVPYGSALWLDTMITTYHLEATVRPQGRPRKND